MKCLKILAKLQISEGYFLEKIFAFSERLSISAFDLIRSLQKIPLKLLLPVKLGKVMVFWKVPSRSFCKSEFKCKSRSTSSEIFQYYSAAAYRNGKGGSLVRAPRRRQAYTARRRLVREWSTDWL